MWEWFTANGIWVLVASGLGLVLLLIARERIQGVIEKTKGEKQKHKLGRSVNLATSTIGAALLVLIGLALTAVISSREGVKAVITPATIEKWLLDHGIFIISILLVGTGLWLAVKHFLPLLMRGTVVRTKGESKEGIKKRTDTLTAVFMGVGKVSIIIIVIFMILSELKVPIGPVLAGFGVVGIAVGFGAQYLIRDLIAGVFILWENQYRVGDVAQVAGVIGGVEALNLRKTVLRDLDGIVHHIPNGEIKVASNYTRHFSRAHLNISVAYKEDMDRVMSIIKRTWEEVAEDPDWGQFLTSKTPWLLRVNEFGDSGIIIKVVGDTKPLQQWNIMGELRRRIKRAFDEEGIEIPWPHVKLYMGQEQPEKS